jgi:uncharacterized membrane protein
MKFLLALSLVALVMAAALRPTIEEKVEEQIHESEALCDSAAYYLHELQVVNDSLIDVNFPLK